MSTFLRQRLKEKIMCFSFYKNAQFIVHSVIWMFKLVLWIRIPITDPDLGHPNQCGSGSTTLNGIWICFKQSRYWTRLNFFRLPRKRRIKRNGTRNTRRISQWARILKRTWIPSSTPANQGHDPNYVHQTNQSDMRNPCNCFETFKTNIFEQCSYVDDLFGP